MSEAQNSPERPAARPGKTPVRRRPCGESAHAERSAAVRDARQPVTAAPTRLTADDVMTAREVAELLHAPVKIGKRRLYIRQNIEAVLIGCS